MFTKNIKTGLLAVGAFTLLAATTACSPQQPEPAPMVGNADGGTVTPGGTTRATGSDQASGGASDGAASDPAYCKTSELKLDLGAGDGSAGADYGAIQFTNTGSRTCTLISAPGVSYVAGDDGHQVGEPAERVIKDRPQVTLKPGDTASAPVEFSDRAEKTPEELCGPQQVRGMRVYPPQSKESAFIPLPDQTVCTIYPNGEGHDRVGVVRPGPDNNSFS